MVRQTRSMTERQATSASSGDTALSVTLDVTAVVSDGSVLDYVSRHGVC